MMSDTVDYRLQRLEQRESEVSKGLLSLTEEIRRANAKHDVLTTQFSAVMETLRETNASNKAQWQKLDEIREKLAATDTHRVVLEAHEKRMDVITDRLDQINKRTMSALISAIGAMAAALWQLIAHGGGPKG